MILIDKEVNNMASNVDRLIAFVSCANDFISVFIILIVKRVVFFLSFDDVNIVFETKKQVKVTNGEEKEKSRTIEKRSFLMLLVAQSFPQ